MSKTYFGGIPTSVDTRRLDEQFAGLMDGDEITHDEIEVVIGVRRGSSRYRTVTDAWRRSLLREKNIELAAVSGVGFRCLPPAERISASVRGVQSGMRKQLRSITRSAMVRTEDEGLRRKQDLLQRYGAVLRAEASKTMQEIEPPKPTQSQPRLVRGGRNAA